MVPDLENWVYLPTMRFGEALHGMAGTISEEKGFVRLAYYDDGTLADLEAAKLADHDTDGIANFTEISATFTNPFSSDTDGDGLPDGWETANGLDPNDNGSINPANGASGDPDYDGLTNGDEHALDTNPNDADSDDDGITDGGEADQGNDPNDPTDTPEAEWFILTGDLDEDAEKRRTRTVTIPAGQSRLILIALHTEEYPYYTSDQSEFNDTLHWTVTTDGETPITGTIDVNSRHGDFDEALIEGTEFQNFYPSHAEKIESFTAPPDSDLEVEIELSATNIGDGTLPSTVMVGLLPVEVIIPKLDSEGNQIDGKFVSATELKVAKWEDAFEGTGTNGSVKDDFIGWDKDRFYVRIPGGASMGIEAVKVATEDCPDASYNDDATRIELTASGSDSITDSMILVSDDEDDDYAGSGAGADDQDNDRTHKVQLGGKFVIKSIFINGIEHPVNMKVPVPIRKVLPVDFIRMNVAGVRPLAEIEQAVKIVNERYAQVGLRVDATIKELPWPNLPNNNPGYLDLFDEPPGERIGPLTDEYKSFIDQTDPMGTNVYFLLHTQASGVAITQDQLRLEPDGEISGNYFDKAFVNSISNSAGYTSAHELAHLLAYRTDGVNDHSEPFWNLLSTGNPNQNPVFWSKRLNGVQQGRIDQHPRIQNP